MFYQIILSPQVKRSLIIINKLVYTSCRTNFKVQNNAKTSWNCNIVPSLPSKKKIFSILAKDSLKIFSVVRYFSWKLEFFSNILSVVVGFCSFKNLIFRGSRFYHSVLIITRIWVYINQFIKTCFLSKNFYLRDTFLSGFFFLEPKLTLCSLRFRFDIYFKINLVLTLRFKVIMWKICFRKILNVNLIFFNSLTSVISNFIFAISHLCKKRLNLCVLSVLQFICKI